MWRTFRISVFLVSISLLLLLGSCSVLRLSYSQGPLLAWWWLDGYANFNREQALPVKEAIRQWFDWHRETQLAEYAARMVMLRNQLSNSITPTQVCSWSEELRALIAPAMDRSLQLGAPVMAGLSESQLGYLEQRFAKDNNELHQDYLQPDMKARLAASVERTIKRVENFYGRMDKGQRALIVAGIAASPFDAAIWLAERQHSQRTFLMVIRELATGEIEEKSAIQALRPLAKQFEHSDDTYRAYQAGLMEYNCAFAARIHNSTSTRQRQHAHDKLKHWENDLRALIAGNG